MSTATHRAKPDRFGRAWRGFRRWRRSRPFWGGLFTLLAGVEILATTKVSLAGLTLQMGPTGFLSWLIPTILVTCGLLLWLSPAQRLFYSIVAAVTAVYSLIGVNLGGFFVGMLLGMVGSALGFAWVPVRGAAARVAPTTSDDEPVDEVEAEPALVDELLPAREDEVTGPLTDTLPQPRNPLREPAPVESEAAAHDTTQVPPATGPDGASSRSATRDPKTYVVTLVLLSLAATGVAAVDEPTAVQAAPTCPTSAPARPGKPAPTSARPTATATPSASATADEAESEGNLLTRIVDGIGDLLTGGDDEDDGQQPKAEASTEAARVEPEASTEGARVEPEATASASASAEPVEPSATASATPTRTPPASRTASPPSRTRPGNPDTGCATSKPPTKPAKVEPGKLLPTLSSESEQLKVAAKPGKLTGSAVKMTGLTFEGIAELDIAGGGKLKALKFSMQEAVTDDFVLAVDGPDGKSVRYETKQLIVRKDVAFYATRFVGWLGGLKITLTPNLPFPDGIPITSPIPITFTDPVIDLAFISCGTLTADTKGPLNISLA
ncbi:DUF6114 domain-containing protein [Micromonospora costi]|uniref:DUF6114 domain-containing protein n=1 Tax=Micromonospora costi TaxID=1530042 RepID=UPI0033FC045C